MVGGADGVALVEAEADGGTCDGSARPVAPLHPASDRSSAATVTVRPALGALRTLRALRALRAVLSVTRLMLARRTGARAS